MKAQRSSSMHRSGTMPFSLPKITKLSLKQSRYPHINQSQNRSSFHFNVSKTRNAKSFIESKSPFTARVEQQVLDQNEYPYTETTFIQKEQSKLKDLLKQFNEETVNILEKYVIDKPVFKQHVKKKHPVQEMYFIRDKEAQNAHNLTMILKHEIEKLESRCQNLKYISKEEFQHRIKELKEEKQKIVTENKEISRQITLNGLEIVRGKDSLVRELEYEQFLIDSKRDRLKKESESVSQEIISLETKTKQLTALAEKYEQEQSYTLKKFEELQREKSQTRLQEELSKRKKILQHNKIINQSTNYQLKHKYFQKLKELDEFSNKEEDFSKKIKEFQEAVDQAKNVISQLQKKQLQYNHKAKSISVNANINFVQSATGQASVDLS